MIVVNIKYVEQTVPALSASDNSSKPLSSIFSIKSFLDFILAMYILRLFEANDKLLKIFIG
jgi:hypothetical protein